MNKQSEQVKNVVVDILKKSGVKKAALFGSVVRDKATQKSDVDILIEFKGKKSLFDLVHLKMILEDALGKRVDLLTYNSLHPLLKKKILDEQEVIL
jgi:predicted nucleotidyltransferase